MVPRWALRFWPDTRAMVDDLVGFAPSNHGTTEARDCETGGCSAASTQQSDRSAFMRALNSYAETWRDVSYTSIYTRIDQTVRPNDDAETGSSSLRTGAGRRTNVAIQDICPNAKSEHLAIGTVDPIAYALAMDALSHDGPADPKRVALSVCAEVFHEGVDPVTGPQGAAAALASFQSYKAKTVEREPPLACYTRPAGCGKGGSSAAPALSCVSKRRFAVRLPGLRRPVATLAGKRVSLRRRGGRLAVRNDDLAILRGADQVLSFQRGRTLVQDHGADRPESGEGARTVVELACLRRVRQQDPHATCRRSSASFRYRSMERVRWRRIASRAARGSRSRMAATMRRCSSCSRRR